MSEKEVIELEESGDEEDLGKYMIDDDEEEDGVEEVKEIEKLPKNIEKSEQKTIDENKYGTKYYDTEDTDQLRKVRILHLKLFWYCRIPNTVFVLKAHVRLSGRLSAFF